MRFPFAGPVLSALFLTAVTFAVCAHAGNPSGADDVVVPKVGKRQTKAQVAVNFVRNEGNLALFELAGNYNRDDQDGSFNLEARAAVADAFYTQHADEFDFLVVFTTFEFDTGPARAFYVTLYNDIQGIGQDPINLRSQFQNSKKLQGYIDMAALSRYELDTLQPDYDATLDTLLHETMHRWGVHAQYRDGAGNSAELLGYQAAHWSQFVSSDASVMGGGRWRDNGDGSFTATDVRYGFNPADLYLAGFLPPEQVPDFFYLRDANGDRNAYWPNVGDQTPGTRVNVSIAQIIQALGARVPAYAGAQRDFRAAFLLLSRPGEEVSPQRLAELNDLTRAYSTRFSVLTRGLGIMRTFLAQAPTVSIGHPHLVSGGPALGGSANLTSAADWLLSQQQPGGYWEDKPLTRVLDTVHALAALEQLNISDPALERARTWLRLHTPANDDERAWIVASGVLNQATATLVDELQTNQRADGGWSLAPGLHSSAFDTALVLQQLQASGIADPTALDKAIAWLNSHRQLGWGPVSGGGPTVDVTARALSALLAGGADPASLGESLSWLISRQNPDGSFGQAPGTSHETALVLRTLTLHPDGSGQIIEAAAQALEGRQTANGSWDGSIYATAQAILALRGRQAPNLSLAPTIVLNPAAPRDGDIVQLSLRVANNGLLETPATVLRLYDGDPAAGGQPLGPDIAVPALDSGAGAELTAYLDSFGHAGQLQLTLWLDPDNSIQESNENDNLVRREIAIADPQDTPELDPLEHQLVFEPGVIATLPTDLHVAMPLRNPSTTAIASAQVALMWQVDEEPWQELTRLELAMPARTTVPVEIDTLLTRSGQVRLRLVADPDNQVAESDETNNTVAFAMGQQASLDLTMLASDLALTTATPTAGEDVHFTATLRNLGTRPSPPVRLQAWIDGPAGTSTILDQTAQLLAGDVSPRQLVFRAGSVGTYRLRVAIDSENVAAEANETNNQASLDFEVFSTTAPNLSVDHAQMAFSPLPGLEGQPLTVTLPLTNTSNTAAGPFRVDLYQGAPGAGGVLLASQAFPAGLAGAASATITITSPPLQGFGERQFFIAVDADNQVAEHREDDNSAFEVIQVLSLPDLAVAAGSIDLSPALPVPGEPVLARITVDNLGQQPASNVAVELYERDEEGAEVLVGSTIIALVPANGSAATTLNWSFGQIASTRELRLVVDAGDSIAEGHEDNNSALAPTSVQDRHFFASQRYISPNGDSVQDEAELVFSVDQPGGLAIEIRNGYNRLVRDFSGGPLDQLARGAVVWDGRDNSGVLVRDGDYRVRLVDPAGELLGQLVLTVDTNRTPILAAAGTPRAYLTDLRCSIRSAGEMKFGADGKYVYAKDVTTLDGVVERGLFRMPTRGRGLDTLVSRDWLLGVAKPLGLGEYIGSYFPLADGRLVFSTSFSPGCTNCDLGLWLLKSASAPPVRLNTGSSTQFYVREANTDYVIVDGPVIVSLDPLDVGAPMQLPDNAYLIKSLKNGGLAVSSEYGDFNGENTYLTTYYYVSADPGVAPVRLGAGPELTVAISDDKTHVALFAHTRYSNYEGENFGPQYGELSAWQVADSVQLLFSESTDLPDKWDYNLSWSPTNQLLILDGPNARMQLRDRRGLVTQTMNLPTALFQEYMQDLTVLSYRYGFDTWNDWEEFGDEYHPVRWDDRGQSLFVSFHLYIQQFAETPEKAGIESEFNGVHLAQLYRFDLEDGQPQLLGTDNRTNDTEIIFPHQLEDWNPNRVHWPARTDQILTDNGAPRTLDMLPEVSQHTLELGGIEKFWPGRPGAMTKKLLVYNMPDQSAFECLDGNPFFVYESADNLLAHLEVGQEGLVLELKGVAADLNLDSYQLDWAYANAPNTWFTLSSPSSVAVVDDVLDTWVPPEPGAYLVRLTVRDRAGNLDQVVRTVQWFDQASLASVKAEPRYISPNGDGIQDATLLTFRVLEPLHLDVTIEDETGHVVRTLVGDYPVVTGTLDTLVWDGRNQAGNLVRDGVYLMRVQNRRFRLVVDNTPPQLNLYKPEAYTSREVLTSQGRRSFVNDEYSLGYRIFEPNLSEGLIDFEGPLGGRHEFARISGSVGTLVYNLPVYRLEPHSYSQDPYRISARDLAGNAALFDAGQPAPELIFSSLRQVGLEDGKPIIVLDRLPYQSKPFVAAYAPSMTIFRHSEHLALEAVLTTEQTATFWIEYIDQVGNWVSIEAEDRGTDVPELERQERSLPFRHILYLPFDQLPGPTVTLRMRADINGLAVTSNMVEIVVEPTLSIGLVANDYPLALDGLLEPAEDNDLLLDLVNQLEDYDQSKTLIWVRESLSGTPFNPRLVVTSSDDARYATATQFVPLTERVFEEPSLFSGTLYQVATLPCNTYEVSFVGQFPRPDGPPITLDTRASGTVLRLKRSCIDLDATLKPVETLACAALPSNRLELNVGLSTDRGEVPTNLEVYVDVAGREPELVANRPRPAIGPHQFFIDTTNLPEGRHNLRIEAVDTVGERTVENIVIPIDRTLPQVSFDYPADGSTLCAEILPDGTIFLPLEGVIRDANAIDYELFIGNGHEHPDLHMIRNNAPLTLEGTNFAIGELGTYPNEGWLKSGEVTARIAVYDWSGAVVCVESRFTLDISVDVTVPRSFGLFSPNGDGNFDTAEIPVIAYEPLLTTVELMPAESNSKGEFRITGPAIDTLVDGQTIGGEWPFPFLGLDGSNQPLPDGVYALVFTFEDPCGLIRRETCFGEIDTTPPLLAIDYPDSGDPLGAIVEVLGSFSDANFSSAEIAFAEAGANPLWSRLERHTRQITESRVIASWPLSGLAGDYLLRLSGRDQVANEAELIVPIHIDQATILIWALNAAPRLFSPNADGVLDTTQFGIGLSASAVITATLEDGANNPRRHLVTAQTLGLGTHYFEWDGRGDGGIALPDGVYKLVVRAEDPNATGFSQEESLTVVLDTTAPELTVANPGQPVVKGQGRFTAEYDDLHANDLRITYSLDGAAAVTALEASANGRHFGLDLADLAEGDYALDALGRDLAGNNTRIERPFAIDNTPPLARLDLPLAEAVLGGKQPLTEIRGAASDSHFAEYRLERGAGDNWTLLFSSTQPPPSDLLHSWTVTGPDGPTSLRLTVTDQAGWKSEDVRPVIVDTTAPTVLITAPADGAFVSRGVAVRGTASDANIVDYRLQISPVTGPLTWSDVHLATTAVTDGLLMNWTQVPPDGVYFMRLIATDKGGLQSETRIRVTLDTDAPQPALDLALQVQPNFDVALNWTASASTDVDHYQVFRNDTRIGTSASTTYTDPDVSQGEHRYHVVAVDRVGNLSQPSNTATAIIDRTPPEVALIEPIADSRVRGIVPVVGTATSPDDFFEYRLYVRLESDAAPGELLRSSAVAAVAEKLSQWDSASAVQGQAYVFRLEGQDTRGNIAAVERRVIVDNLPPAAPTGLNAVVQNGDDARASWNANSESDLAGYLLYLDGQLANATGTIGDDLRPYLLTATNFLDLNLSDGPHSYVVHAVDTAGNISAPSAPAAIVVETGPPDLTFVQPLDGTRFESALYLLTTSADRDLAQVQFAYSAYGSGNWIPLATDLDAPFESLLDPTALGLAYGDYQLRATATDTSGLADPTPAIVTVTFTDLEPPDAVLALTAHVDGYQVELSWQASTAPDLAGYLVYRQQSDGSFAEISSVLTDTQYLDTTTLGPHLYLVRAVDTFDNASADSNLADVLVFQPALDQPFSPTTATRVTLHGRAPVAGTVEGELSSDAGTSPIGPFATDAEGAFALTDIDLELGRNTFTLTVTDQLGNRSVPALTSLMSGPRPQQPQNPTVEVTGYDVSFDWQPPAATSGPVELEPVGYRVFRDGQPVTPPQRLYPDSYNASSRLGDAFRTNDDNPYTYWYPSDPDLYSGQGTFFEIQFQSTLVQTVRLDFYWGYSPTRFALQGYDGAAWIDLARFSSQSDTNLIELSSPYYTDRLRLLVEDFNRDYFRPVRLAEFQPQYLPLVPAPPYGDTPGNGQFAYTATTINGLGFESDPSAEASAPVGDLIPPEPVVLSGQVSGVDAVLSWTLCPSPDLAGYGLYRDGSLILSVDPGGDLNYTDANLTNATYTYHVVTFDTAGNQSASNFVALTIAGEVPPAPTLSLTVASAGNALELSWVPNGPEPAGYILSRANTDGGPYQDWFVADGSQTQFTDSQLQSGHTYYYVVVAIDSRNNRSERSNQVAGTPTDDQAPAAPVITYPVRAGQIYLTEAETSGVGGTAEPGSRVEISRNGQLMGSVIAPIEGEVIRHTYDNLSSDTKISPDGNWLLVRNYPCLLVDSRTGQNFILPFNDATMLWVPDSQSFWAYHWSFNGQLRRYDLAGQVVETFGEFDNINMATVSPDQRKIMISGSRYVQSEQTYRYGVWAFDRDSGEEFELDNIYTWNINERSLTWSPDNRHLAFIYYDGDSRVHVLELATRETRVFGTSVGGNILAWDKTGSTLFYTRHDTSELYRLDLESEELVALTNDADQVIGTSPENDRIAFRQNCCEVVIHDLATGENSDPIYHDDYLESSTWHDSGRILSTSWQVLNEAILPGTFWLPEMPLLVGDNRVGATARDDANNRSQPADPITIRVSGSGLPDLAILQGDLTALPAVGLPGTRFRVNLQVRNLGQGDAPTSQLVLLLTAPDGSGRQLLSQPSLAALPAGATANFSVDLDQETQLGTYRLTALVDGNSSLRETDEANNLQQTSFRLYENLEPALALRLDRVDIPPGQNVTGIVEVYNPGTSFSGRIVLTVADEYGFPLDTVLDTAILDLAYGEARSFPIDWDPENSFAGSYQFHAVLVDNLAQPIDAAAAPFTLGASATFGLTLALERTNYQPDQAVVPQLDLRYLTGNTTVDDARLIWSVIAPDQTVVREIETALPSMLPGYATSRTQSFDLADQEPGDYRIHVVLVHALGETETDLLFTLDPPAPVLSLTGTIAAGPRQVPLGSTLAVAYSVVNRGQVTLSGVPLTLSLRRAGSLTEVASASAVTATLGNGQQQTFNASFATTGLGFQSYLLVLSADLSAEGGSAALVLDTSAISLIDASAPLVEGRAPLAGAVVGANTTVRAFARDALSPIAAVTMRLDGGLEQAMGLSSQPDIYRRDLFNLAEGEHTLAFSAADTWSNRTETSAYRFTVDLTPPQIDIAGVLDNAVYNHAVTPVITVTEAHPASLQIRLNGQPFSSGTPVTSEGPFALSVVAVDQAGNRAERSLSFTLDLTAPLVQVSYPSAGAVLTTNRTAVTGTTEAAVLVTLVAGAYTETVASDASGAFAFADVPIVAGLNHLLVHAVDRAGNVGPDVDVPVTSEAPNPAVAGTLTLPGAPVAIGADLVAAYQIHNTGNVALSGRPLRISVYDVHGNLLTSAEATFDLQPNQQTNGSLSFASTSWLPGNHRVDLQARIDDAGPWLDLDSGLVLLDDRTPPSLTLLAPANGALLPADFGIEAEADDQHSQPVAVSYLLDGVESAMALVDGVNHRYAAAATGQADGTHQIAVRAVDGVGNQTTSATLTVEVDGTAPVITIDGVAEGQVANSPVSPIITVSDAHPASATITLDGAPYVSGTPIGSEGEHQLAVSATDQVGNTSARTLNFRLDLTPPQVVILSPANGATVSTPLVQIVGSTEPGALVALAGQGLTRQTLADASGAFHFDDVPLTTGENHFDATATDRAGNTGLPTGLTLHLALDPPLVAWLEPAAGPVAASFTAAVAVTSPSATAINAVELFVDGALHGAMTPDPAEPGRYFVDNLSLAAGNHQLRAQATDANQSVGASEVRTVTVPGGVLQLAVSAPSEGATIDQPTTTVIGTTSPGALVTLTNGAYTAQQLASDGSFSFAAVPVAPGLNTLIATATLGGQSAELAVHVTGACHLCAAEEILVDEDVTLDFNGATPVYLGDPDLAPFFRYAKYGSAPQAWRAEFRLGERSLRVADGARITVRGAAYDRGTAVPGLLIADFCSLVVEQDASIDLLGTNAATGSLVIEGRGDIAIAGQLANRIEGTWGVTGELRLLSRCGDIAVAPTGKVLVDGTQEGARDLAISALGGNIHIAGLVDAVFGWNRAPNLLIAAYQGAIVIDGGNLLGIDPVGSRPVASGVSLRCRAGRRPGNLDLIAGTDLTVHGFGYDSRLDQSSASFTLDQALRADGNNLAITVNLSNSAPNQVRVELRAPGGHIDAFFANVFNHALLTQMSASGADLNGKFAFSANAVDGLPNQWLAPPGGWDLAVGFKPSDSDRVVFTLQAPGLTWQQLMATQRDGWAIGALGQRTGKQATAQRMGMRSPLFDRTRQYGTVAIKSKQHQGGNLTVRALGGSILAEDFAFDNANKDNASAANLLEACGEIELSARGTLAARPDGNRAVVNVSGIGAGGRNTLRASDGAVTVGQAAEILALGTPVGSQVIQACDGVFVDGSVAPADPNPGDDSGSCDPGTSPSFTSTPVTSALVGRAYAYTPQAVNSAVLTLVQAPLGMTFENGRLSWTPDAGQVGSHQVELAAVGSCGLATQRFTVVVAAAKVAAK